MSTQRAGFTLIEVLVALVAMAIIGSALVAIMQVLGQSWQRTQEQNARMQLLMGAVLHGWQDASQAISPPNALATSVPPLSVGAEGAPFAVLRSNWQNPFDEPRSSLQQVTYRLHEGELLRQFAAAGPLWMGAALPRTTEDGLRTQRLGALSLQVQLQDDAGELHDAWPPTRPGFSVPRQVRFTYTLPGYGEVPLLVPVPALPLPKPTNTRVEAP
jgi:general secretion pathway protein J